jgi:hypothetical protein
LIQGCKFLAEKKLLVSASTHQKSENLKQQKKIPKKKNKIPLWNLNCSAELLRERNMSDELELLQHQGGQEERPNDGSDAIGAQTATAAQNDEVEDHKEVVLSQKEEEDSLKELLVDEVLLGSPVKTVKPAKSPNPQDLDENGDLKPKNGSSEDIVQGSKSSPKKKPLMAALEPSDQLLLPLPSPHYALGQGFHQMKSQFGGQAPASSSSIATGMGEDPFYYYNAYYNPPLQSPISLMDPSNPHQGGFPSQENLMPPSALYPSFNPSVLGKRSYAATQNIIQPSQPKRANLNAPRTPLGDRGLFEATYSNVEVYEFVYNDVAIMRRKSDSWINGTHILKAAGIEKGRRTKILEKEVHHEEHEKVQGGYGRYQGTWYDLFQFLREIKNGGDKLTN